MAQDQIINPLDELLTEKELLDLLGLKKETLADLRLNHKLPFCKITRLKRLYLVVDIMEFIKSTRTILNRAE